MSIRLKIAIIFSIIFVIFGITLYVVTSNILLKSYETIEREQTTQNLERVDDAIKNKLAQLDLKLSDWAKWDDTYEFIIDKNDEYIKSNLGSSTFSHMDINAMVFVNTKREIVYSKVTDQLNENQEVSSEQIISYIKQHTKLFSAVKNSFTDIIVLPEGLLMLAAQPILTSEGSGPSRGFIFFGKFFTAKDVKDLSALTHLQLTVYPLTAALPTDVEKITHSLSQQNPYSTNPLSDDVIAGYGKFFDKNGSPLFIFKTENDRVVYKQGKQSFFSFINIAFPFSLLFVLILLLILHKMVIARFIAIGKQLEKIGQENNFHMRLTEKGKDEIAEFSRMINRMLFNLSQVYFAESEFTKQYKIIQQKLKDQLAETEAKNMALEVSKKEISNALEETKHLEEALITEKENINKKVEERTRELLEEKARLSASINSLMLGYIMTDEKHAIVNINKAAQRILHLSIQNSTIEDIQKELQEKLDIASQVSKCLATRAVVDLKDIEYGSNYLHIFIAPIVLEDNHAIGVVTLIEDITETKALERSRDEFFSIASHELRTPLTAIKGNTSMIRDMYADKLTDPDLKQMIDDIHDGSARLITVVNDFLNVSRLEQKRMVFKKEAFDVSVFIKGTMKDVEPLVKEKNITMTYVEPSESLPQGFGDKDRLKEVLLNLLANAVKFTDVGGIEIHAQVEGKNLKVRVMDTGKGIPLSNQSLLFRKFQQASNNILTRDTTSSTGLGLYIAKLIMEGMGGTIGLEKSEERKGSTFVFTIPIAI